MITEVAYDLSSSPILNVQFLPIERRIDEYFRQWSTTNSANYLEIIDPLSDVEIFEYPPLDQLRREFEATNSYSPSQLDKLMSDYAKLPQYQH